MLLEKLCTLSTEDGAGRWEEDPLFSLFLHADDKNETGFFSAYTHNHLQSLIRTDIFF